MGICERMRGWKWQCDGAGALRAGVGVMLLGISLAQSVPSQTACAAAASLQSLTQPNYLDTTPNDTSAGFMKALVQSFLNTVQPKPFPGGLLEQIVKNSQNGLSDQKIIKDVVVYQVGFLVCAAIGILYIVLMPIVGFFLACCRCCGNCGGKMYQKQTSSIHCRRRAFYWSTFVTTIIILAGNICMFRSNEAFKVAVNQGPAQLTGTIDNIQTFITTVPQQVQEVVDESQTTIQEVTSNLDDIGPRLGRGIQEEFNKTLDPALYPIKRLNQEITETSVQLNKVNSSLTQLQSSMDRINANLTAVKSRINRTLSNQLCTSEPACAELKQQVNDLTVDTSITVPNLSEFRSAVDEVVKLNLTSKIEEVKSFFNSIPERVNDETKEVVQKSKEQLNDIKTQISQVTDKIPVSGLTNLTSTLNNVKGHIEMYTSKINRAERIRWIVGIVLCCVVLLIVVCNLLGLVLGPIGLSPKADPTKRSCTSSCGGIFFMMGAGFSFIFSWLFMIIVLLLFLLGGNVYTLLCRPWNNGQLLMFIDTSGLVPDFSQTLGLKVNINISDVYRDCEDNQPLWTTLHLNEVINLNDFLNVSKYTEEIQQQFEKTNITLSKVTLLSPEIKNQLRSFTSKADDINTTAVTQQMNNLSRINLNTTAEKLEDLKNVENFKNQPNVQMELQSQADDLRRIQIDIEMTILPQLENLNSTIKSLRSHTEKINQTVGEVLSRVEAAQDFLDTNTTQIVKTESRTFLDCQLGYFTAYANWANRTITQEVGRCRPVAEAVNLADVIVCSYVVESLNAFWFSLGWCLIFFIPSIIFSIKLAKYYRRMKYADVYDDHIIMNPIPRPQMKMT